MAIFTRCFNHYMAFVFIIVRILRVHRVNELQEQIYKESIKNNEDNGKEKPGSIKIEEEKDDDNLDSNDKSKRKRIQNNLVKARMMREERMCTDTFINILIPLSFLGMMANFIPYLMIFVPI